MNRTWTQLFRGLLVSQRNIKISNCKIDNCNKTSAQGIKCNREDSAISDMWDSKKKPTNKELEI